LNQISLLIVNITLNFSLLSSVGSASECDGLYEKHQSFELEPKYEAFFDQVRLASERTQELVEFLKKNKIKISSIAHLPETTYIISSIGKHPINRLAKIYAADGIQIAFSPNLTAQHKLRGAYIKNQKIVILESKFMDRPNVRGLTITDFHELLHARVDRNYSAHLFNSVIHHLESFDARMATSSYGTRMSMSEQLTFRQDVRLASGKLKLWSQERLQKRLSKNNKWLEYIWPSHKPIIRENILTIKDRIGSQLSRMRITDNGLAILMESFMPKKLELAKSQNKPGWISIRHRRDGQNWNSIVRIQLTATNTRTTFDHPPAFEFTINLGSTTKTRWPQMRDQIMKQLNELEQRLEGSRERITKIELALKAFEIKWSTSKDTPKNLVAEAEALHQAAKDAHQHWLAPN
jgi:hypothetical protein